MSLITKKTDYAIKALIALGKSNKSLSATYLAKKLSIPKALLRNILQTLANKKYLASAKGIGGGFSILKKPNKIALIKIIEIFQGKIMFAKCMFKKNICPHRKNCPLRYEIKKIEEYAIKNLKGITIASLLSKTKNRRKNNEKENNFNR